MRLTPHAVLEHALDAAVLTEDEKDNFRQNLAASLVLMHMDFVGYAGTEAEDDCPRELGSKHARPEGLSAGARYLRGEA